MLCSQIKQIILTKTTLNNNVQYRCLITSRTISTKWVWLAGLLENTSKRKEIINMSPLRIILRDIRAWSAWTRSGIVNTVVRRFRKDRGVFQSFRQVFFRPRRILLLSATATYKAQDETNNSCNKSITDEELKALLCELDNLDNLSKALFCTSCGKRSVIDKKMPGIPYCSCSHAAAPPDSDGWVPYMEAEDVVIWRKEYKPGLGLYAYKVYGRYPEVMAADFAAIQVDSSYRKAWDSAVASLCVVEQSANGLPDQAVLHWEVLWPRLFANRDYVYIRRHKEFAATPSAPPMDLFHPVVVDSRIVEDNEPTSVHSNAKRRAREIYAREASATESGAENKVYIIVSRSCEHPNVPETKHAIRVSEYWSHMVVKTINGADKCGMEFVLTYYDEPAVGGMPTSVAAWASGRAAPAYLRRMRTAAAGYRPWRRDNLQDEADLLPPFVSEPCRNDETAKPCNLPLNESDMESSRSGPEMEQDETTKDQSTQTDNYTVAPPTQPVVKSEPQTVTVTDTVKTPQPEVTSPPESETEKQLDEEEKPKNGEKENA